MGYHAPSQTSRHEPSTALELPQTTSLLSAAYIRYHAITLGDQISHPLGRFTDPVCSKTCLKGGARNEMGGFGKISSRRLRRRIPRRIRPPYRCRETSNLINRRRRCVVLSVVRVHTLSGVWSDPCSTRRALVAGGLLCCVDEHVLLLLRAGLGTEITKPEPCLGFSTTKANLFCSFLFSDSVIIACMALMSKTR